jgi:hypothetical protein
MQTAGGPGASFALRRGLTWGYYGHRKLDTDGPSRKFWPGNAAQGFHPSQAALCGVIKRLKKDVSCYFPDLETDNGNTLIRFNIQIFPVHP